MQAWVTHATGDQNFRRIPVPEPMADELLVEVLACGLCRTDLHVVDGDPSASRVERRGRTRAGVCPASSM
jgi:propanol-preferring alcohol dehydrogenase